MIQYVTFLLVLFLVIDRLYHLDFKKVYKHISFHKNFKNWAWTKVPKRTIQQRDLWRQDALNEITADDHDFLKQYDEPFWKNECDWSQKEIEDKKRYEIVWGKVKMIEKEYHLKWIKSKKPLFYYLIKLKLI